MLNNLIVYIPNFILSQVANGLVRANAVGILIDVFPLVNPEASNEEMDALLQKQFDTLLVRLFARLHSAESNIRRFNCDLPTVNAAKLVQTTVMTTR